MTAPGALVPIDTSGPVLSKFEGINHREIAAEWVDYLDARAAAGDLSPRTREAYSRNITRWLNYLDACAVTIPTPNHVLTFVGLLRSKGLAAATINAHLDAVRGFYKWTETQNIYPAIARSVRGVKVRKDDPLDCLAPEEVAGLLDYIKTESLRGLRDCALVHVLFSTGLRLVSLCGLNLEDLNPATGELTYKGKGDQDKTRKAYLAPGPLAALSRYLDAYRIEDGDLTPEAPLFVAIGNRARGKRLTLRSVRRVITGLMEQAGHINRDERGHIIRPRIFSAHSLRRTAITAAYDAQGLDAAQTLAGHKDPKTTQQAYARVKKGQLLRDLSKVLDLETIRHEGEGVAV